MMRFATWKIVSILLGTLLAVLLVVPSLLPPAARDALVRDSPSWLPARTIVLGLDLQGGAHVLLEIDTPSVVRTKIEALRDDVRRTLREENVRLTGGIGLLTGVVVGWVGAFVHATGRRWVARCAPVGGVVLPAWRRI